MTFIVNPTWSTVGFAAIGISLAIRHWKVYDRVTKLQTLKIPGIQEPAILTLAGQGFYWWASMGMLSAWITIMLFFTNLDTNIILQRVTVFKTGHLLVWVAIFLVYVRYGLLDPIKGILVAGTFGVLHEELWGLGYFYFHPDTFLTVTWGYLPYKVIYYGIILSLFVLFPKAISWKKWGLLIIGLLTFNVLWTMAGFPVTVDLITGNTGLFSDLSTNLIEDLSWIMPALLLL